MLGIVSLGTQYMVNRLTKKRFLFDDSGKNDNDNKYLRGWVRVP